MENINKEKLVFHSGQQTLMVIRGLLNQALSISMSALETINSEGSSVHSLSKHWKILLEAIYSELYPFLTSKEIKEHEHLRDKTKKYYLDVYYIPDERFFVDIVAWDRKLRSSCAEHGMLVPRETS